VPTEAVRVNVADQTEDDRLNSELRDPAPPTKTIDQMLDEARAQLPHRPSARETLRAMEAGAVVIDIRDDERQRRDGLMAGALVIRRNVLEWRCDPASPWRHRRVTYHGQKIILVCNEGYQSSLAATILHRLGQHLATDMAGGFVSWRDNGLPIVPYDARAVIDAVVGDGGHKCARPTDSHERCRYRQWLSSPVVRKKPARRCRRRRDTPGSEVHSAGCSSRVGDRPPFSRAHAASKLERWKSLHPLPPG
jgi:rhodanese-related sulfurtransferase